MRYLLCLCVLFTGVYGQAPNPPVPTPQPPQENRADNAPVAPPGPIKFLLSREEENQREIIRLKRDLMQAQVEKLQQAFSFELQGYLTDMMRAHQDIPGLTFDMKNFVFFVQPPVPSPVKPETAPAKPNNEH